MTDMTEVRELVNVLGWQLTQRWANDEAQRILQGANKKLKQVLQA